MMSEIIPLVKWGSAPETPQEALRTFETICQGKEIKSIIIIALDEEREVISAGCGYDNSPFTLVGALEMMKREVMGNIE